MYDDGGRSDGVDDMNERGYPMPQTTSSDPHQRRSDEQRLRDLAVIDSSQAAFAGIPGAELEREIDLAIRQARTEARDTAGSPTNSVKIVSPRRFIDEVLPRLRDTQR